MGCYKQMIKVLRAPLTEKVDWKGFLSARGTAARNR